MMSTSIKFQDFEHSQKVGFILIMIASVMKLVNMFNLLELSHFVEEDLPNYIFGIGGILFLSPHIFRRTAFLNKLVDEELE